MTTTRTAAAALATANEVGSPEAQQAALRLEAARAHLAMLVASPLAPTIAEVILAEYAVGDAESALWLAQCAEAE